MREELIKIYNRDLERLQKEIEYFNREESLWKTTGQITNPAGNLCLHLIGNLNTYIGKNLGETAYVRNRDLEFSQKNIPKEDLISKITDVRIMIEKTLSRLEEPEFSKIYPENVLGYEMTIQFFLIHLVAHLSYHLGQINYLRRVLEQ